MNGKSHIMLGYEITTDDGVVEIKAIISIGGGW